MSKETIVPFLMDHNRIQRPYIGGEKLHEWRKMEPVSNSHWCEELLVTSIGAISKGKPEGYGISKTVKEQGSQSIKRIIVDNPNEVLGEKFQKNHPNDLKVLARVGDTVVRLVLQCHPRKEDAIKYFGENTGKTEAWYIADTQEVNGEKSHVYAGFKSHVTKEYWRELFKKQDVEAMVDCLHKIYVQKGDVILIPAGMPHAVGPGCLFLEIHECSDITIRVERVVNGVSLTDKEMFNGLSYDDGLELFDYSTYSENELLNRVVMLEKNVVQTENSRSVTMIDESDTDAFEMMLVEFTGEYRLPNFDGHRILVPAQGDIKIAYKDTSITVQQGWGVLIPAICKDVVINAEDAKIMIGIPTLR